MREADNRCYWIRYPVSRSRVQAYGDLRGPPNTGGMFLPIIILDRATTVNGKRLERGSMLVVDPRAAIYDAETRQIEYNPRECAEVLPDFAREYLNEHPDWPPVSLGR